MQDCSLPNGTCVKSIKGSISAVCWHCTSVRSLPRSIIEMTLNSICGGRRTSCSSGYSENFCKLTPLKCWRNCSCQSVLGPVWPRKLLSPSTCVVVLLKPDHTNVLPFWHCLPRSVAERFTPLWSSADDSLGSFFIATSTSQMASFHCLTSSRSLALKASFIAK